MMRMFLFSEAGGHPTNEDAVLAEPHPGSRDCWLVSLADGQGGRANGARAAQVACRSVLESARLLPASLLLDPRAWPPIVQQADEAVANDAGAGFTTLVGLCLLKDQLAGVSCGDSAVLALSAGSEPLELSASQVKDPPVGSGAAMAVSFECGLTRPWRVLAMSDGVWKYVGWPRLRELASRLGGEELLSQLQQSARLPGSGQFQDDFTVVVLEDQDHGSPDTA